jgi:membrane-bound serine protease (ClpP class)
MNDWMTIVFLLVLAMVLITVDFYLPGFVLGSIGVVLMVVALFVAKGAYGWGALLWLAPLELALGGVAFYIAVKVVPQTRTGKKLFLTHTQEGRAQPQRGAEWIGQQGVAHTVLRPSGVAVINGNRLDVQAESGMIPAGSAIQVVAVQDNNIIVRKV